MVVQSTTDAQVQRQVPMQEVGYALVKFPVLGSVHHKKSLFYVVQQYKKDCKEDHQ